MSIILKLTLENFRRNKHRALASILGVMLASALMYSTVSMVANYREYSLTFEKDLYGDFHEMYEEVPTEYLEYIERNENIERYFYAETLHVQFEDRPSHYALYRQEYDAIDTRCEAELCSIFVRYKNAKNYKNTRSQILATIQEKSGVEVNYRTNIGVVEGEDIFGWNETEYFAALAGIVLSIIVVASIVTIRNGFSISASERKNMFGVLASIGATPKQIRKIILSEGLIVGIAGSLSGVLLGIGFTAFLVTIANYLVGDFLGSKLPLLIIPQLIMAVMALSITTVLVSALAPARKAAKVSPIEAIRGMNSIKIKAKKIRASKLVRKIFGIGGVMAQKSLKRSRDKYSTTVMSIVLSVSMFISLSTFVWLVFGEVNDTLGDANYNTVIYDIDRDFCNEIRRNFSNENSMCYSELIVEDNDEKIESGITQVVVLSADYFEKYVKTIDSKADNNYAVLSNTNTSLKDTIEISVLAMAGSGEEYSYESRNLSLNLIKTADKMPLGDFQQGQTILFVSDGNSQITDDLFIKKYAIYVADTDKAKEMRAFLEVNSSNDIFQPLLVSIEDEIRMVRGMYALVSVFLYGFIVVISLIGLTNIFNTIVANMTLRAKEFAVLRSVGMSPKEFDRMIRLESIMYASRALIIGVPTGVGISYLIYRVATSERDVAYRFPVAAIVISIVYVAIMVSITMGYSASRIKKQNIIETIRRDNV